MAAPLSASAATFYVDGTNGDDANDGSGGAPMATIQAAIDAAWANPGDDTVAVWSGEYTESLTIMDDSGLEIAGIGEGQPTITASDSLSDVVYIISGDVKLFNLALVGGDDGVDAENDYGQTPRLHLQYVNISDTEDEGVEADDIPDVIIEGGSFNDNDSDGLNINDSDSVTVTDCEASGNGNDGIDLGDTAYALVENCMAFANGGSGLEFDDLDAADVINNNFSGNDDYGLDLDEVGALLVDRVIAIDNLDDGLYFRTNDMVAEILKISLSTFAGNGDDGVRIVDNDGSLIALVEMWANSSVANTESGFDIDITGTVEDYGYPNLSEDNGEADILPGVGAP
ncbi:MAG: right-handed parallel beta-helix repeat-containing protein [Myxococcota bacterium]